MLAGHVRCLNRALLLMSEPRLSAPNQQTGRICRLFISRRQVFIRGHNYATEFQRLEGSPTPCRNPLLFGAAKSAAGRRLDYAQYSGSDLSAKVFAGKLISGT